MQARLTTKISRIFPPSIVLAHLQKCVFSAQIASCGQMKNALVAVPIVFA